MCVVLLRFCFSVLCVVCRSSSVVLRECVSVDCLGDDSIGAKLVLQPFL